jgi:hypothetical protein
MNWIEGMYEPQNKGWQVTNGLAILLNCRQFMTVSNVVL